MCHFCTNFAHIIKFRTVLCKWWNLSPVCHISHVLWQICPLFVTSYSCYDKFCPRFVTSLEILSYFCHILHFLSFCYDKFCPQFVTSSQILSNFCHICWIFIHFLCIKCIFWRLSHFCHIFCHMGQILSLFWHLRNPVIPRVFAFGQKFVTFVQILSPVCHVFVTPINRVVMRFIHKIYINVTNIYKSLTKFF